MNNKGLVPFLLGGIVGYNGVKLLTHALYLTIIFGLAVSVYLK